MTPERFRWCLQQLLPAGWSVARLARYLQIDPGTTRHMGRGRRAIPANLEAWLEREARAAQEAKRQGKGYVVTTLPDNWIEWKGKQARERE